MNPDGPPYAPRKPRDLHGKKGRIKGRMFETLKIARHLKSKGTPMEVLVGFTGRVSRIARIHQYGLRGRVERKAPEISYARRELLSPSKQDIEQLCKSLIDRLVL